MTIGVVIALGGLAVILVLGVVTCLLYMNDKEQIESNEARIRELKDEIEENPCITYEEAISKVKFYASLSMVNEDYLEKATGWATIAMTLEPYAEPNMVDVILGDELE